MNRWTHAGLALLVLLVFGGLAYLLVTLRREPPKAEPEAKIPSVEVIIAKPETVAVSITANGTVRARTTTQLTPQVSGQIIEVNPNFHDGGYFQSGDVLLRIDPVQYEMQLANARAQLASAELALEREEAVAKRNRREWNRLDRGEPTGLAANIPQLVKARADVEAAQAALRAAEHDVSHTEVKAPYAGRVRAKLADVGQSVSAMGTVLGEIYAVDYAEVVLPLPSRDAWFLDLPDQGEARVPVTLSADLGGGELVEWQGTMDRSTGLIDPNNRFVNFVARVDDPYGLESENEERPPLQIGQFVTASVRGRLLEKVISVPRDALLPGDRVHVVTPLNEEAKPDQDGVRGTLDTEDVRVLRKESDRVLVSDGLREGDWICLTRLPFVGVDMEVTALPEDGSRRPGKLIQQVQP